MVELARLHVRWIIITKNSWLIIHLNHIAWLNEPGILVKLATIVIKLTWTVVKLNRKFKQEY
jgi:hypothetical protein